MGRGVTSVCCPAFPRPPPPPPLTSSSHSALRGSWMGAAAAGACSDLRVPEFSGLGCRLPAARDGEGDMECTLVKLSSADDLYSGAL